MWCDLYLIADTGLVSRARLADIVYRALAEGEGVTAVQLRDKHAAAGETRAVARELRALTTNAVVPFVLNDDIALALAIGADGVHLGPDDAPMATMRASVPPGFLLGYSAGTAVEATAAQLAGATYLGVGAAFATTTKADAGAPIGPAGIAAVRAVTGVPLVAIGGITLARVAAVIAAGADGVAVAGAILLAADPAAAARALRLAVAAARTSAASR